MIRRTRFAAACLAALAIVFAQLAVAAHWCDAAPAGDAAQATVHHEGCHEPAAPSGDDNANLCQAHCQYGAASVDSASPVPPVLDVAGPVLLVCLPSGATPEAVRRAERFAPVAAPPPPAILFGVLRI